MLTVLHSRLGIATGTLLAAVSVAACGGSPSAHRAPSAKAPTSTARTGAVSPEAGAAARGWMREFCTGPAANAWAYIGFSKPALEQTKPRGAELASSKEEWLGTANGFTGEMVNNAKQLAAATPPKAADAASTRLYLLGVYHRLNRRLLAADRRLLAAPVTSFRRFMATFAPAISDLIAATKRARQEIGSNPVLGPALDALDCGVGTDE